MLTERQSELCMSRHDMGLRKDTLLGLVPVRPRGYDIRPEDQQSAPAPAAPRIETGDRAVSLRTRATGIATQLLVVLAVVSLVFAALSAVVVAAVA